MNDEHEPGSSANEDPVDLPASEVAESISNIAPYGAITVCKVNSGTSEAVLSAARDAVLAGVTSTRRRSTTVDQVRRSAVEQVAPGITAILLSWQEAASARTWLDGRKNVQQKYALIATDGRSLAFSTDSNSAKTAIHRWIGSDKQGFVAAIPKRVFRDIETHRPVVAAWLRNTTPHRHGQFTGMALTGSDVGRSARANDLASYLAKSVRREYATEDETAVVTINAAKSSMYFKKTDGIRSWVELVEIAFAWIYVAVAHPRNGAILPGTADLVETLDAVGPAYEVVLTAPLPDPLDDEIEGAGDIGISSGPGIQFEVIPAARPDRFECLCFVGATYTCRAELSLKHDDEHWQSRFRVLEVADTSLVDALRDAVVERGVEIHFKSEHLYADGLIAHRPMEPIAFRGYDWQDFEDFEITKEKPKGTQTELRELIGTNGEDSLFSWTATSFNKGWTVCDDGAFEIADFVHLNDEELTLIAVKGASKNGGATATTCLQEVEAQAAKNLLFLDDFDQLSTTLTLHKDRLVVFRDGIRQDSPEQFLEAVAALHPADVKKAVKILQPQLQRSGVMKMHREIADGCRNSNHLGMMRIDSLLRTLDGRCAALGIEFTAIGRE